MARKKKDSFGRRSKASKQHLRRFGIIGPKAKAKKRLANVVFPPVEENARTESIDIEETFPELIIEQGPPPPHTDPNLSTLQGRRVVDIRHLITQARELERHRCGVDARGTMRFVQEHRYGLLSIIDYKCSHCNITARISTDQVDRLPVGRKPKQDDIPDALTINDAAVWGAVSTGMGHDPLDELLSMLGVPAMSAPTFRHHESSLGQKWQRLLAGYMESAAMEEIALARADNPARQEPDGIPWTTGIVDGGWSQRSHGHRFSAKSGCAVIIGFYTKKLLFLGVRNKFCSVCARAANKEKEPASHICFLNWHSSSTAMESDIIAEGFKFCEEVYNLRILKFVGDGDSSVHSAITNRVPYGIRVQKIECANHIVKNLTKNFYDMAKGSNGKYLSTPRIKHLSRCVRGCSSNNKGNVALLLSDLRNIPDHVLSDHTKCRSEVCKHNGNVLDPQLIEKFPRELLAGIRQAIGRVAAKAHSLVTDSTSNLAEYYMSLVAKFTGGKQINRSQQGSYTRRCHAAGLSFQHRGKWHARAWKDITSKSPNVIVKRLCARKEQIACRKKLFLARGKKRSTTKTLQVYKPNGDEHYGPNALQPDPPTEELTILTEEYYRNYIHVNADQRDNIEKKTRTQSGYQSPENKDTNSSQLWWEERRKRLTASNFGLICRMKDTTSCRATVKRLLYDRPVETSAMSYGKSNESVAVAQYEELRQVKVQKCGLFIDLEHCFLAASPDGLVSNSGVMEVKCPYSAQQMTPSEAARTLKNFFCFVDPDNHVHLQRTNKYFYQVQAQLHITGRLWCDFVVWTPKGMSVERITKDDTFWSNEMFPKLHRFFHSCLLPELVNPRHTRGMEIREGDYILEAQQHALEKKGKKRKTKDSID